MQIASGTRLGAYEVLGPIGAGGMGEVYRAVDTRLDRQVAIKVLPESVAANPERTARFQREAKILASLNHPHIAALFGLEQENDRQFLVMELIDGETLADRIARGPLSVDEALDIALCIAEALEAAHESGIVHRDLKPANIKLATDGRVKVLDFGLARAAEAAPASSSLTKSPTFTALATEVGVILGTAAYMAPEQAKGLHADHRSDVFSFGVVLYEMLTGRNPFRGESAAEMVASVLISEPDLAALPSTLNRRLVELLRRCLSKNPKQRWQAIGDVRVELEMLIAEPRSLARDGSPDLMPARRWKRALAIVIWTLNVGTLTASGAWFLKAAPSRRDLARFMIPLGEGEVFTNTGRSVVAMSPDGQRLAYVANQRLYLRSLAELVARPIPGTEAPLYGVTNPVFSPDGESLVFWAPPPGGGAQGTLKRIPVTGGAAVTLCPAESPFGMTWDSNMLYFADGRQGIMRVSASGGEPEVVVRVKEGESLYGPQMLPDGKTLLLTSATGPSDAERWNRAHIIIQSVDGRNRKTLIDGGADGRYVPSGHIVYAYGGTVFAVAFDARRLDVRGKGVPIVTGVRRAGGGGATAQYAFSQSGSLVFVPGPVAPAGSLQDLALVDRMTGAPSPLKLLPATYQHARISPDGNNVTFSLDDGKEVNVWIYELNGRTAMRRLTFGGNNRYPIWAADGQRIAFQSDREKDLAIFWQRADASGSAERLTRPDEGSSHTPESWSPADGGRLLYTKTLSGRSTLWAWALKNRQVQQVSGIESTNPIGAVFSPDGRWIAYSTSEQAGVGSSRLYVQPYLSTGEKHQIAPHGHHPMWSADGRAIFFEPGQNQLAVIPVQTRPAFSFESPVNLLGGSFGSTNPTNRRNRDITPAGKLFIAPVLSGESETTRPALHLVQNWFEELKRLVPTN